MKKIVSSILILILLFDICGHVFLFIKLQKDINHQIKSAIFDQIPLSDLEIFKIENSKTLPGFYWLNSHEFRYYGKMYDIVKRISLKNSEILYCVHDSNEEFLINRYCSLVSGKIKDFESKYSKIPVFIVKSYLTKIELPKIHQTITFVFQSIILSLLDGINNSFDQPPEFKLY